jgi:hypothetical protein
LVPVIELSGLFSGPDPIGSINYQDKSAFSRIIIKTNPHSVERLEAAGAATSNNL